MNFQDKCVIIIPVLNEEATIGGLITSLQGLNLPVLVVDDGSSDATSFVAEQAGAMVLRLPAQGGAWAAIQCGFACALRQGASHMVTMDGDGQHDPMEISKLLNCKEHDIVIGSYTKRGSFARHVAWLFFRFLSGLAISDLTSGFRLYSRRAARLLLGHRANSLDFQDIGVLLLAKQFELSLHEVPVLIHKRSVGKSHIFHSWLAVSWYMLVTFILSLAGRKRIR